MNSNEKDILYLGSASRARRILLEFACIPHKIVEHGSDEQPKHTPVTFQEHVLSIAQGKMSAIKLPDKSEVTTDYLFALTADSLIRTNDGTILGKPVDKEHGRKMIAQIRQAPVEVVTGCCLEKFNFLDGQWKSVQQEHWTTGAVVEFIIEDDEFENYLEQLPVALRCSGTGVIEEHGLSYLKSIKGSYTAVMGLPLYELRKALKKMKFKF